jgi:hypothetical protein
MHYCGFVKNYVYQKYFSFIEFPFLFNNTVRFTLIKSGISEACPLGQDVVI